MHAMKAVGSAATLALGVLALAPADALAQDCYTNTSVYLASGYSPVEYSRDAGATWSPAHVVAPWFTYDVIPGTSYINYQPSTDGVAQTWTDYRTSFYVPPPPPGSRSFNRRLTLEVHADNVAWAFLDGSTSPFFQQPWTHLESNFQGAPETQTLFISEGHHDLRFSVFNHDLQTALDFRVVVEEQICEPCDPRQRICEAQPL
jgi:hypothetical protein